MMSRITVDEWQLWSNYGYGWECETAYNTRQEAITDLRLYRQNAPQGEYKLLKKRIRKN